MVRFFFCALIILFSSLLANPRRVNSIRGKLALKIKESEKIDNAEMKDYELRRGDYVLKYHSTDEDLIWYSLDSPQYHVVMGGHPDSISVFVNPAAPKYFHCSVSCKKVGSYRKLDYYLLRDLLRSNKTISVCPECVAVHPFIVHSVQFILSE